MTSWIALNKVICYADDTTLFSASEPFRTLERGMDMCLNEAEVWSRANNFKLNEQTTQNLVFSLRQIQNESECVKFLGLHLYLKLNGNCLSYDI